MASGTCGEGVTEATFVEPSSFGVKHLELDDDDDDDVDNEVHAPICRVGQRTFGILVA